MDLFSQNPHGADLKMNCSACHTSAGWEISAQYWQQVDPEKPRLSRVTGMPWGADTLQFHHNKTKFELKGQHANVDCRGCHENLVFSEASTDCISCHQDMHQQTLGTDCARCHTSSNWLVDRIPELHFESGFPLTGVHQALDCAQCHQSASNLQFERIGNDCASCHLNEYNAATNPDHKLAGFSTDCSECHDLFSSGWGTAKMKHDFFPLTQGHDNVNCSKCHIGGSFTNTPTSCVACHQPDYNASLNPSHTGLNLPTDCAMCHTTDPGWAPASFPIHNNYYALNGAHAQIANDCATCHPGGNYNNTPNTCAGCHTPDYNATTNPNHAISQFPMDCATCHSETVWAPTTFNHNTVYPLTGAHAQIASDCAACHHGNYTNTPNTCASCHTPDFNGSTNPNHAALNIPTDCAMCHTTAPGWEPATFPIHNNYYALNGAHAQIANQCALCHPGGNYNNTPNTCAGCHTPDYNGTSNPNHTALQFSTDCTTCHSETAWAPATFDHDAQYFPIYSGKHKDQWNACADCHANPSNYAEITCTSCHTNPQTNDQHNGIGGYTYNSSACLACHPTGDAANGFDHNNTNFPLTGAHLTTDCIQCHANGYAGTPTQCVACHTPDFNQSLNPNHVVLNIPADCAMCHTTAPGWAPATFPIHNNYYALNGAHALIANQCATCHNGNYKNTPNTCFGCHAPDYNSANSPKHASAGFPTTCEDCHTETAWEPSSFNHDQQYFPIYSGKHKGEWNQCVDCHTNPGNFAAFSCIDCHEHDSPSQVANDHQGVNGYQYVSTACFSCHPNGN